MEEVIKMRQARSEDCFFWSTYSDAEIDLLLYQNDKLTGFEFKYVDAPKMTKSMKIAFTDLELEHLYVIYPGSKDYKLSENIAVVGFQNFLST